MNKGNGATTNKKLLEWVDEDKVAEVRADRAARAVTATLPAPEPKKKAAATAKAAGSAA